MIAATMRVLGTLYPEGVSVITRTPKITGKGQIYFVNLFAKESNKLPLM